MEYLKVEKIHSAESEKLAKLFCSVIGMPDVRSTPGADTLVKFTAQNGIFYAGHFEKSRLPKEGDILKVKKSGVFVDIEDANGNTYSVTGYAN